MCGRFYGADIAQDAVLELTGGQDLAEIWRNGDIRPSENAPVLVRREDSRRQERPEPGHGEGGPDIRADGRMGPAMQAASMSWGFLPFRGKSLLINARAETALEKQSFSDSVRSRRCLIPAAGFYEWDREKRQYAFTLPESPVLFMAGIWRPYGDRMHFTILTTAANKSMAPVHDRMPLILPEKDLEDWIFADGKTGEYLKKESPLLERRKVGTEDAGHGYEQLTLPGLF